LIIPEEKNNIIVQLLLASSYFKTKQLSALLSLKNEGLSLERNKKSNMYLNEINLQS